MTDGIANDLTTAAAQAAVLKSLGVSIFVVAIEMADPVSAALQAQEIKQLASSVDQHIFVLRNASFIGEVRKNFFPALSKGGSTLCFSYRFLIWSAGGRAWRPP